MDNTRLEQLAEAFADGGSVFSAADLPANIASGGNEGIAVGLTGDDDFRARWATRDLTPTEVGHVHDWFASQILSATVRVASGRGFDPSRLKIHWR